MTDWDPRALAVLDRLEKAGYQAVLVGGCVRDGLLGRQPHDYDAASSALPEQIEAACAGLKCVETGLKHGTVTVLSGGLPVEMTTFRREGAYSDHRRPDKVEFTGDLNEDLARRDFTVNAMAWGQAGLVDPFGGRADLERRLIRCVGDPDRRFWEDALRPLRGLRLAAQLEFGIEAETAAAIRRHLPELSHVAWERISAEFVRLLCSPGAGRVLLAFPQAAAQIVPELAPAVGFGQRNFHHCYDVYQHSVHALEQVPPTPALRLAALLHDVGKPATFFTDEAGVGHFYGHDKAGLPLAQAALERLRLPKALQERVLLLIRRHHLPVEEGETWAGRWLARLGPEALLELLALKRGDALTTAPEFRDVSALDRAEASVRALLEKGPCLSLRDLAVDGRDAMAAGLSGRQIGEALDALLDLVSSGELPNQRPALLAWLARRAAL